MVGAETTPGLPEVRYLSSAFDHAVTFSVCTLVASQDKYDRMLRSFRAFGFTDTNSEFLAADNRAGNHFDGYTWMRRLYPECRGRYVIFCHDDVELVDDGYDDLVARLEGLSAEDAAWVLAGNAGARYRKVTVGPDGVATKPWSMTITDPNGTFRMRRPHVRVESLDENFIIMRREAFVGGSLDLGGFHFWGPDLCLVAEFLGGKAYAVNFHLRHHSRGKRDAGYRAARERFRQKYSGYFPGRTLVTTTGPVALTPN